MTGVPASARGGEVPLDDAAGTFTGLVVLDLTQIYNGPYATFLLARGGATVVKVEPPGGESLRKRTRRDGVSDPFVALNANKRSMVLDLKREAGRTLLLALARRADVIVENYAPGVMERLGLGREVLHGINPRLVIASGSGYGSRGPYRDYPAMDLSMQAMSGVMATTGEPDGPPLKAGPALCDFLCGIHLHAAIVGGLYRRTRTGKGCRVEVSMMAATYPTLASNMALFVPGRGMASRTGNRHGGLGIAPYNVYPAADGHIAILAINERHWESLVRVLALDAVRGDPRFVDRGTRVANMDLVDRTVAAVTSTRTKAALFADLMAARVPCAPVRELEEVVDDPHLHATGMLKWIDHPRYGRQLVHDSPIVVDGSPNVPYVRSPDLGEHTRQVLAEFLGMSDADVDERARQGAFDGVPA